MARIPWNKGKTHSESARAKIRDARLRQKNVAFGVPGVPNTRVVRWWEELRKDPVRYDAEMAKRRGHAAWNKGRPLDPEHYAHLVTALRGRKFSDAGRKALSDGKRAAIAARGHAAHFGCKQTPESVSKRKATCERLKQDGTFRYATPNTGSKHHMWGKPAPKGSGIGKGSYCLKGHWVRSTWERTVADWFHSNNVPYEYEPQLFDLGKGLRYRPDFYLPKWKLWVEVKGYVTKAVEQKIQRFTATGHRLVVIGGEEMSELQDLLSSGH